MVKMCGRQPSAKRTETATTEPLTTYSGSNFPPPPETRRTLPCRRGGVCSEPARHHGFHRMGPCCWAIQQTLGALHHAWIMVGPG